MAHFYGTVRGPKGEASRLGSKVSGLTTVAASWHGAIRSHLYHDPNTGADSVRIERLSWPSRNVEAVLYEGPVALAGGPSCQKGREDGTSGQDRDSYSDTQDRDSYAVEGE